jgi:hypothetical protein
MTKITDVASDYWESQIKVNRALWRSLKFTQQQEIGQAINDYQQKLEEVLREAHNEKTRQAQAQTKDDNTPPKKV